MHTLHLVEVKGERYGSAARGVTAALREAGYADDASLARDVSNVVTAARAGAYPIPLVKLESRPIVVAACDALHSFSNASAVGVVDLDPLPAEVVDAEPQPEGYATDAVETTIVLLATAGGNVIATYSQAKMLARTTRDAGLYEDVCAILANSFDIKVQDER